MKPTEEGLKVGIVPVPVEVEVVELPVAVVDVCGRLMVFVESEAVNPDTGGELKVPSGVEEAADLILGGDCRLQLLANGFAPFAPSLRLAREGAGHQPLIRIGTSPPRPGFVWAPGYYRWDGHRHVWVDGHFMRERRGSHWVPEHWDERHGRYHFEPGHWEHR